MRNNIKKLRLERQWTQAELAKRLSASQQNIQKLEVGEVKLTDAWIDKLIKVFGCNINELLIIEHTLQEPSKEYQATYNVPSGRFDIPIYLKAVESVNDFTAKRKLKPPEDLARELIEKAYSRLKGGQKLDDSVLQIYYEDMVPPDVFK